MLRRRPVAVYRMLDESEPTAAPDAQAEAPAMLVGTSGDGGARRTLAIALTAAALVGFAVWELLGLASESSASRPAISAAGLPAANGPATSTRTARQPRLARRREPRRGAPGRSDRPRAAQPAAVPLPPSVATAPTAATPPPAVTPPPAGTPRTASVIDQGLVPRVALAPPSAEWEFGFER